MKINIVHRDIFEVSCDAYVNPTDVNLSGNGGLDQLIQTRGQLHEQCAQLRGKISPGNVEITTGGRLPVKYVLHAVSPQCAQEQGDSYDLLQKCYINILLAASGKSDIHHLAIPLVGTGAAGYSLIHPYYEVGHSLTAVTILSAIASFPNQYIHARIPGEITIVCSSEEKYEAMIKTYKWIFGKGISKRERIRGALLGGAIGDALGYPVEFKGAAEANIKEYIIDPKSKKALISDDTQMTLFTACGLLFGYTRGCMKGIGSDLWNYISIAYEDWLKTQDPHYEKRKPEISWIRNIPQLNVRRAPGVTCLSALEAGCGSAKNPINYSKGCGGVMRIAPIPLYGAANRHWNQEYNAKICAETAALTHGHPLGWLSAVALGNILFDIMENFSLAYCVADTIRFLKKNYNQYADTQKMIQLLQQARVLADMNGYTSSVNLMAEYSITEQLGEGWVGEEALAVGLYCVLATTSRGFDQCLWNAVGHKGDSDSTASIAGQIWGAYFGESALAQKWLQPLELRDVITEIADDLTNDCRMSEYSPYNDGTWCRKYLGGSQSTHIPHADEDKPHYFVSIPWNTQSISSLTVDKTNYHGEYTGQYHIILENGSFLHRANTEADAHTGFPGFGFTNLHFNESVQMYEESHGWVKVHEGGTVEGYYCNAPFTLLPNHAAKTIEIFSPQSPTPWIGTIRRRTDEWDNPLEVEFRERAVGISVSALTLILMNDSLLRNFWHN